MARETKTRRPMTRLEFQRRTLGLSQYQLGHDPMVGIHQSFISLLEMGRGIPTPHQAERLARRLGLHPDDLLKPVVVADDVAEVEEPDHESTAV